MTTTPIPASPIPQTPQKIGTRYVAVNRTPYSATPGWYKTGDAGTRVDPDDGWDIYALLDPSDAAEQAANAAELERLRNVEDEAAANMLNSFDPHRMHVSVPVENWDAWEDARAARIAFEAKIGGGK